MAGARLPMPHGLLDRLDGWKRAFGTADPARLEALLAQIAVRPAADVAGLIRLHETLLFLRAYPQTPAVARLADEILFSFAGRVEPLRSAGTDLTPLEEPEVSGISGTSLSAIFTYEAASRIAAHRPRSVEINWDAWETGNLGALLRRFIPLMDEDWPVEAHVPYRDWIGAARGREPSDLIWLLKRLAQWPASARERAELYDSLRVPLLWTLGDEAATRSRLRLEGSELFCHRGPLLRRGDVSLQTEIDGPEVPIQRVPRREAQRLASLIVDTSAMRYRELYGFNHPDTARMFRAKLGRGVEVLLAGVPPEWRLPLRAYHAGMFFKNGVPAGYIEVLSLFERAEVGFNLYYTFRDGESAWLYARLLRVLRQVCGVTCFSVDPYQIGHENPEAIESGAFWFYRKLGFRPLDKGVCRLLEREERRMRATPGYRSSRQTLQQLARSYLLFDGRTSTDGDWDAFHVRNLGLAANRLGGDSRSGLELVLSLIPDLADWTGREKTALAAIVRAKNGPDECRYLRLMQQHWRLRAALLKLGASKPPEPHLSRTFTDT